MIKIALLGFGNVGQAFAHYLEKTGAGQEYPIYGISDSSGGLILRDQDGARQVLELKESGRPIAGCAGHGSFSDVRSYIDLLHQAGIRVLVESLPTNTVDGQPALDLVRRALDQKLAVVTVDKGPIVHAFQSLVKIAALRRTKLAYSGTTGVRPPAEISGCHVSDIHGILNGTTNYILTEMQEHRLNFPDAVALAQSEGVAEPNPELDTKGWDTACKILILANEWMNAQASLAQVVRIGIGPETEQMIDEARAAAKSVRLIGRARLAEGQVRLTVAPRLVGPQSPLFSVSGTSKGAVFVTREKGEIFAGGLSGRDAISDTILRDVRTVAADVSAA
jgi:homoserine dehydrogenase